MSKTIPNFIASPVRVHNSLHNPQQDASGSPDQGAQPSERGKNNIMCHLHKKFKQVINYQCSKHCRCIQMYEIKSATPNAKKYISVDYCTKKIFGNR